MISQIKNYLSLGLLALVGGLLVLLKIKDSELHQVQIQSMKDRFKNDDEKEDEKVKKAKEEWNL